jgi:hypothetical protein
MVIYVNRQGPQTLPAEPPTALIALVELAEVTVMPLLPPRSVFLKSHCLKLVWEQVVDGIEPFKAGLDVSESVWREEGRELGGVVKLLFVIYLFSQLRR